MIELLIFTRGDNQRPSEKITFNVDLFGKIMRKIWYYFLKKCGVSNRLGKMHSNSLQQPLRFIFKGPLQVFDRLGR